MATSKQKQQFIEKIWSAIRLQDLGGLFPSVLIAQAALESAWGTSSLAKKYNNLFGIKAGSSWTGPTVNLQTGEVIDGTKTTVNANFRVYDNWKESIKDRNKLLKSYSRYKKVFEAATPEEQAEALQAAGYATALNYALTLKELIRVNNLKDYDTKKKELS